MCNEPGPTIPLTIKAMIREPISIVQKEIVLETPYRQQGKEYYIEVQNYDKQPWDSLRLSTRAGWFAVESYKLPMVPPDGGLQETWRIAITPKAEHMKPDWYQELLEVSANGYTKIIPIRLRVLSKVELSPGLLFFGFVEPGVIMKKELVLRFREDVKPQVDVSVDLGNAISWRWIKQEFPVWVLEVGLTANYNIEIIDGMLTLKFSDTDIEDKNVSIKAMVKR